LSFSRFGLLGVLDRRVGLDAEDPARPLVGTVADQLGGDPALARSGDQRGGDVADVGAVGGDRLEGLGAAAIDRHLRFQILLGEDAVLDPGGDQDGRPVGLGRYPDADQVGSLGGDGRGQQDAGGRGCQERTVAQFHGRLPPSDPVVVGLEVAPP
jgi:hypothetical protein